MQRFRIKASPYTELFWRVYQFDPKRTDYNIVIEQVLNQSVDKARLTSALRRFVEDHPLFNAHLTLVDDALYWEMNPSVDLLTQLLDSASFDHFCDLPFDMATGPLYRFGLYQRDDGNYHFVFIAHHVLIDGLSGMEMVDLLTQYYSDAEFRVEVDIVDIERINCLLHEKVAALYKSGAIEYWREALDGFPVTNDIPIIPEITSGSDQQVSECYFRISYDEWSSWSVDEYLGKRQFSVLIAAWALLCSRLSNQERTHVNFPMSIREGQDFSYAAHVNTLIYPITLDGSVSFYELVSAGITHLKSMRLDEQTHFGYLPTPAILQTSAIQSLNIGFAQTRIDNKLLFPKEIQHVEGYVRGHDNSISGDDVSLEYAPTPKGLSFRLAYRADKFGHAQMERIALYYQILVKRALGNPYASAARINFMPDEDIQRLSSQQHKLNQPFLDCLPVHHAFSHMATREPEAIALVTEKTTMTYQELERRSSQLASLLVQEVLDPGIPGQQIIALCFEPSIEMLVALLAVLKAGHAFVAISVQYPPERAQYVIEDSGASKLLCAGNIPLLEHIEGIGCLDISESHYLKYSDKVPETSGGSLAYLVYTSGTTGRPKGVKIRHHGLSNLIHYLIHSYPVISSDKLMLFAPLAFDASIEQIFNALVSGAQLHLLTHEEILDPKKLSIKIQKHNITQLDCTPTFLHAIAPYVDFTGVQRIVVGGEAYVPAKLLNFQGILINTYGPSETTITATMGVVDELDTFTSIGCPVDNTVCYVLDRFGQLVPQGVFGELYISGVGLSSGYRNLAEHTNIAFLPNPFIDESTTAIFQRVYKTGDIVRWRSKKRLEYQGRIDDQVKIRGYRIELAAVETILSRVDGVLQAAVNVEKNGNRQPMLIAFYVSDSAIDNAKLHFEMAKSLPVYMLPQAYVLVDSIPVTTNGKVNRTSLPAYRVSSEHFSGPRNDLEEQLCHIWQNALGTHAIGIFDDFFALGADSISCIKVVAALQKLGFHCSTKNIGDYANIANLAYFLREQSDGSNIMEEQGRLSGYFDLLPMQHRFFDQSMANPNHYNHAFLIKVFDLDLARLQSAIEQLVERHDALRIIFCNGQQCYEPEICQFSLEVIDCKGMNDKAIQQTLTQWQCGFSLDQAPLWSVGYLRNYRAGEDRLFFAAHCQLIDVISWSIIRNDLYSFYHHQASDPKRTSYRQWGQALKEFHSLYPDLDEHWSQLLLADPWKNYDLGTKSNPSETIITINERRSEILLREALSAYHCQVHDLLLSALAMGIRDVFHLKSSCILFETHGRAPVFPRLDVSQTVGRFANFYPQEITALDNIGETIIHNKESRSRYREKRLTFGSWYYGASNHRESLPLPVINYNFLGALGKDSHAWPIMVEPAGAYTDSQNRAPTLLNINVFSLCDKTVVRIDSVLNKELLEALSASFERHLNEVIDHCMAQVEQQKLRHTPSDFCDVGVSQATIDELTNLYPATHIFNSSSMQQEFLNRYSLRENDSAYHLQLIGDIRGPLDFERYKRAWDSAIRHFDSLRACFWPYGSRWLQIMLPFSPLEWRQLDVDSDAMSWLQADRAHRFEPMKPDMLRLYYAKMSDDRFKILVSVHHALIDNRGIHNLLEFVNEAYTIDSADLRAFSLPMNSHVAYQRYISSQWDNCKNYWLDKVESLSLSPQQAGFLDVCDPDANEYTYLEISCCLSSDVSAKISELARQQGVSDKALCHFAWQKLLNIATKSRVTMATTTVSGRNMPVDGLSSSAGLYLNFLPIIMDWQAHTKISSCLRSIQCDMNDMEKHSFYPLLDLELAIGCNVQSSFIYDEYPTSEMVWANDGLTVEVEQVAGSPGLALSCRLTPGNEGLGVTIIYRQQLLRDGQAQWVLARLLRIFDELPFVAEEPHISLDESSE
ncbi:Linear gramicidin synthase subunit B [BD1-7 clade bacterium]|uniref:Linear gramicidin synthase subunit B n=1 Tax=BD1-7 clade bacterium TaxID=2029982 RepID=A0A5S9MXX7_9GAMM|nr:Linear gramicidin synthase subunit B [BD1-7 clade bacterium]